jgi:hypothetical protein
MELDKSEPIRMNITLYRGISIPAGHEAEFCSRVCADGIAGEPHAIRYIGLKHLKLADIRTLRIGDIELREDANSWSFACGDREGACFYAHRNSPKRPILLCLSVDVKSVHVDGRDFLNTAFGFCQSGDKERKTDLVKRLFGKPILPYWQRALECDSPTDRQKLAEAASIDDRVVLAHLANRVPIFGRYNTRFCSAFAVQLPLQGSNIAIDEVCLPWKDDISHVDLSEIR